MTSPSENSIATLQKAIRDFRDARNWRQFHSPKNLSMSIAIEAAELMEHFQWLTTDESGKIADGNGEIRAAIGEELADVLIYCFSLADIMGYDVTQIIHDKLISNETKYPVDRYHGRY